MLKYLSDYLKSRGAVVRHDGNDFHTITWRNTAGCGRFRDGWDVHYSDDFALIRYRFRDIDDPEALRGYWLDVAGIYETTIFYGNEDEPCIYTTFQHDEFDEERTEDERALDKRFATMSEAIFSLMTRYDGSEEYGHKAFSTFVDKIFPGAYDNPCLDFEEEEDFEEFLATIEDDDKHFRSESKSGIEFPDEAKGFAAIAGMDELKEMLDEKVLWTLTHAKQAEKYKVKAPAGMLLYGPPGCGKTYFAEKFAEESKMNFHLVKPSDLGDRYLHGTQTLIAEMFTKARQEAPCVICIDEIDAVVPTRGSEDANNRGNEINEFLTQMNTASKDKIFIIGTTNRKDMIDPALLRSGRMELLVEISAPDQKLRESLFRFHLDGRPVDENVSVEKLARLTEGYTSSDIVAIVNSAAIKAARADVLISEEHLERAIKATPSSLSIKKDGAHRPIGFKPVLVKA